MVREKPNPMEWLPVFVNGEVQYLQRSLGAIRAFREKYDWKQDSLNWTIAKLLRERLIAYRCGDEDCTFEALEAIENTLRLLGIRWEDVEKEIAD